MNLPYTIILIPCAVPLALALWLAYARWESPAGIVDLPPPVRRGQRTFVAAERIDIRSMIGEVADMLKPLARARATRITLAVSPDRTVWAGRIDLAEALRELVATAIYESPGGQVLVSVLPLGSEMHIAVTDDGRGADQRLRETMARGAEQLIALQGGRIAVEARAQGTTVTVRMPDRVDSHSLGPAREGAQVAEENKHAALAPATA